MIDANDTVSRPDQPEYGIVERRCRLGQALSPPREGKLLHRHRRIVNTE